MDSHVVQHILSYMNCCTNCKRFAWELDYKLVYRFCNDCMTSKSSKIPQGAEEFMAYFNIRDFKYTEEDPKKDMKTWHMHVSVLHDNILESLNNVRYQVLTYFCWIRYGVYVTKLVVEYKDPSVYSYNRNEGTFMVVFHYQHKYDKEDPRNPFKKMPMLLL